MQVRAPKHLTYLFFLLLIAHGLHAQSEKKEAADTSVRKEKSMASKAALRSAILPGLGQAYNKKYWKIPLVYGVLAIPGNLFVYNRSWYQKTRFAYTVRVNKDTSNYKNIALELQPLANESLKLYRNQFRKNMDFSILGILVAWGLNVVDATVDGHLRSFDVSDGLTMRVHPVPVTGNTPVGFSLTLHPSSGKKPENFGF